jgi:deoxyribodipyrimidine photo-lyase
MIVFWFRRDLRTNDNAGLFHALCESEEVLPIFIFDKNILDDLPKDDARVTFIHSLLEKINSDLKTEKRSLAVFQGDPEDIFKELAQKETISKVVTNHDYEPYATKRDDKIRQLLHSHNIDLETYKDQVIFEKAEVVKDDGNPYVVYTPYSNRWKNEFSKISLSHFKSQDKLKNVIKHSYPFLSLSDIGFEKSAVEFPKIDISKNILHHYEATRNFPAIHGTSRSSMHLRHGAISIREIVAKAALEKNDTYLKELIWREFFMQILWHFPKTVNHAFKQDYDRIKWRYTEADFKKWCEGKTGFPIVDAGMRQLNATGYMHNRVRLITSGFLCKHLLIDWRWGEAYFAEKLLDYEQSSNVGNWQWAAGSGVDAAPYFRIFNPAEQQKKFDKEYKYVEEWVKEFGTDEYPQPMVDHKEARERCLRVYAEGLR